MLAHHCDAILKDSPPKRHSLLAIYTNPHIVTDWCHASREARSQLCVVAYIRVTNVASVAMRLHMTSAINARTI